MVSLKSFELNLFDIFYILPKKNDISLNVIISYVLKWRSVGYGKYQSLCHSKNITV